MRLGALGAACVLAVGVLQSGAAAAATAPSASDAPPVSDADPDWTHEVTPGKCPAGVLTHYYPPGAQRLGVTGIAIMKCQVAGNGSVDHCRVVSEDPPGYGFGEAAVKMSCLFKMKPKMADGRPVSGAEVTIPLKFKLQ